MQKNFLVDLKNVGNRIRAERKRLNLTQADVTERTGLTSQYWSLLENGRYRGSIDAYLQIAAALGVSLNDLFYDETANIRIQPPPGYGELLTGLNEYEKEILLRLISSAKAILLQVRRIL